MRLRNSQFDSHYSRHKKPLSDDPSSFLEGVLSALTLHEGSAVLDAGCGYGRNSALLSKYNLNVVAADFSHKSFSNSWYLDHKNINPIVLDCRKPLPFKSNSFSAAIIIHFYNKYLIENLIDIIKPSGFLIYESIGGNGENWRELGVSGEVKKILEKTFIIKHYTERLVGPDKKYATVKLVAQKMS
ncbi:class I SAM-dependent methyltransferase [Pseudomonas sp. C9]|uniref:class I SAM-dependent methyltransferase n=1 Tax=Pseudomonas sp. C9 TaxID=1311337 RepID=UPI000986864D|nr:methyltransferase domain-containing protein [Pseudomonas sp. C9]